MSMLLLAHRGDHASVPENTLAAFAAAIARPGCDGGRLARLGCVAACVEGAALT
jgi:hypothetical protein